MKINTGCWVDGCKCFDPEDEDGVGVKRDRKWQGLTDEERTFIAWESNNGPECVAMTEAKLKEKNT
jgi:hypothetical protein